MYFLITITDLNLDYDANISTDDDGLEFVSIEDVRNTIFKIKKQLAVARQHQGLPTVQ